MQATSIKALLTAPDAQIGEQIEVRGWLRSRRDSKGGFSFLAVHDGSAQAAIQVVAPANWRITKAMYCG